MNNFTTGPVNPSREVAARLSAPPIPHRSEAFQSLRNEFEAFMCEQHGVKQLAILQGSGTLANEAMIWQIKAKGGKGIILSNGEFGERLYDLAQNLDLNFERYNLSWGQSFEIKRIEQ